MTSCWSEACQATIQPPAAASSGSGIEAWKKVSPSQLP
jgi:hypothetical protein